MARRLGGLTVVLVLTALLGACSTPHVTPAARGGLMFIDGDVGVGDSGGRVGARSSADDLGLDEEFTFQPKVDLDWGGIHASVNATWLDYSGDGTAEGEIRFGGNVISADTDVRTDLKADLYEAYIVFDILPLGDVIDLGIGAGGGAIYYEVEFESRDASARVHLDDWLPLGFVMVRVAADLGALKLLGTASGVTFDIDDDDATFFEADLSGRYRLFGEDGPVEGHLILGFRYLYLDYEWSPSSGTLHIDNLSVYGPYLGVDIRF